MSYKYTVKTQALQQTEIAAVKSVVLEEGSLFLDFGKAAFGTLLIPKKEKTEKLRVHLGEQLNSTGRIEKKPAGTIRYICIEQEPDATQDFTRITIPQDERNTGPMGIKMPADIGEVYPFRYAEIENAEGIDASAVRQLAVFYPFDDEAAAFESSDKVLNAVWELCKYSIKATTFCGVYIDGDRERIPYEGDAYINQLCHYGLDHEYDFARYSHEYLLQNPTWPTEWQLHSVMMAWADYMYTAETVSLEAFYDLLCTKTLIDLAREDGLISTESEKCTRAFEESLNLYHPNYIYDHGLRDLVDWPPGSFTEGGQGERDNHEMLPINTVVNAFHYHALTLMEKIADVLGKTKDRQRFAQQAELVKTSFNRVLFDEAIGSYIDGEGSNHASLHSNMTALAFGLVPSEQQASVIDFVKSRGMACSVYGTQYLLEALYLNDEADYALELMTATHDRSWWHMLELGSTITLEAWDWKYKNNLDWNHAWGAVPANIIPRFVLGVRPLEPGFNKMLIQPQPGSLERISGKVPTPKGPVWVALEASDGQHVLTLSIPSGTTATIGLEVDKSEKSVLLNGKPVSPRREGRYRYLEGIAPGNQVVAYA
ncbi:MAG: hypothetical protein KC422_11955 [Trueperaceae bacterium]|nr:hypothetical protein [Trueperaceae bacterium]